MLRKSLFLVLIMVLLTGWSLTTQALNPDQLDVMTYWTGADKKANLQAVEIYKLTHPEVKVNYSSMAATEFKSKVAAELMVEPQDVYSMWNEPEQKRWVEKGALMNLSKFWDESNLSAILPEDLKGEGFASIKGGIYLIPHVIQVRTAFYNKKLFEKHDIPQPPYQTWEAFINALDQLKKIPGLKTPLIVASMGEAYGTQAVIEHLLISECGIDFAKRLSRGEESYKDACVVNAFRKYMDLINRGYINSDMFAIRFDEGLRDFGAGKAGIWWRATWGSAVLESEFGWKDGIDYQTFTPPSAGKFPVPALGATDNWAIPTGSENPELAKEFIRTMVSRSAQIAHTLVGGHGLPVNKMVPADLYGPSKAAQLRTYREQGVEVMLISLYTPEFLEDYTTTLTNLVTGKITIDQAIDRLEEARKADY